MSSWKHMKHMKQVNFEFGSNCREEHPKWRVEKRNGCKTPKMEGFRVYIRYKKACKNSGFNSRLQISRKATEQTSRIRSRDAAQYRWWERHNRSFLVSTDTPSVPEHAARRTLQRSRQRQIMKWSWNRELLFRYFWKDLLVHSLHCVKEETWDSDIPGGSLSVDSKEQPASKKKSCEMFWGSSEHWNIWKHRWKHVKPNLYQPHWPLPSQSSHGSS